MNPVELVRFLEQLGRTPDEVAASLKSQGIQGVRNTARTLNPIVRFIQDQIRVDAMSADVMQGDRIRLSFGDGHKEEAILPDPVRRFLDAFNRGEYPELLLPEEGRSS